MLLSPSKISRWGTRISLLFALILAPLFSSNFNRVAGQEQNHGLRIGYHKETGKVNFIGVDPAEEFKLPNENLYSSLAIERPMAYLNHFGHMLGLSNPRQELMEISQLKKAAGRFSTRYQQVYNGVPILAGELIVNLKGDRSLLSISGEISPDLSLSTVPKVSPGQAQRIAIVDVSKVYGLPEDEFHSSTPELWIFDERLLLPSTRPPELVWRIDVQGIDRPDIDELVLINAEHGSVSLHFNTVDLSWSNVDEDITQYSISTNFDEERATRFYENHILENNSSPGPNNAQNSSTFSVAQEIIASKINPTATSTPTPPQRIPNSTSAIGQYQTVLSGTADENSGLFLPEVKYPAGEWAYSVGIGDFNNDSLFDVVLAGSGPDVDSYFLYIFLQLEDGTLDDAVLYPAERRPESVAVGDFNNDGLDDVAAGIVYSPQIDVYHQNLSGTLDPPVSYPAGDLTFSIEAGDLNNDQLTDIAVSYVDEYLISVLYQNDSGTFDPIVDYSSPSGSWLELEIGDMNNDGLQDLVKLHGDTEDPSEKVMIFYQKPDGTLDNPELHNPTIAKGCIGVGDISGDGMDDIILSHRIGGPAYQIQVLEQDAEGSFLDPVYYPAYEVPDPVEISDVNMDGLDDVVVAHSWRGAVSVFLQLPDGTLADYELYNQSYDYSYQCQALAIGDVTGDGRPDIVLGAYSYGGILVLEHAPPPTPTPTPTITPTPVPPGNRRTYDANYLDVLPGTFLCDQTQPECTNGENRHADGAHYNAEATHAFYLVHHGRQSIDDLGMTIISSVHYEYDYQNSFWSSTLQQVVYGSAMGYSMADDVVAHELTHGVTEYTSGLFYYYQSGGINESFSDLWGEFVDLTYEDPLGDDRDIVRWLIGENMVWERGIRDMENPPAFEHPDKMTSPYYYTGSSDYGQFGDNGGIHTNSGVNNKAVYLMTDGGDFNGYHVDGLGIDKVAAIYYEVQTNLLTSGADYLDLYHALYQGCLNLIGGDEGIVSSDCDEVRKATDAVEMNLEPIPGYNPEADLCPETQDIINIFYDDLEQGASNWIFSAESGASSWGWESGNSKSGTGMLWGKDENGLSDSYAEMNVDISLPTGKTTYLFFAHSFGFEDPNYDGGWLEYSIDGGSNWYDATALFDSGFDYTGSIYDPGPIEGANPNRGHIAFVGDSHGYVSSRYDLTQIAGENVRFRWRLSTDAYVHDLGWFVDDVRVYGCNGYPLLLYLPIIANNK